MSLPSEKITTSAIDRPAYEGDGSGFRVMLYSHDTFGLGHISRNLKIASALKERFPEISVLTATGSPQAHEFSHPPGTDYIKLPSVHKVDDEGYTARYLRISFKKLLALRMNILLETVRKFQPHILLVDHAPLGMKKEIVPCLRWVAKNNHKSKAILGLRDIIDNASNTRKRWTEQGVYEIMRDCYDRVLIYGMPGIYDPVSEYDFPDDVKSKTDYCGYIAGSHDGQISGERSTAADENRKMVLVTIGGGDGGEIVIGKFLEMLRFNRKRDYDCVIFTGPFLTADNWDAFHSEARNVGAEIHRYSPEIGSYISRSSLVICTGGYNTFTDILSFARRAIVVPRILYREEQLLRARRFDEIGLVRLIHPDDLTADSLGRAVDETLAGDDRGLRDARREGRIWLDGAGRLAGFIGESLAGIARRRVKAL